MNETTDNLFLSLAAMLDQCSDAQGPCDGCPSVSFCVRLWDSLFDKRYKQSLTNSEAIVYITEFNRLKAVRSFRDRRN